MRCHLCNKILKVEKREYNNGHFLSTYKCEQCNLKMVVNSDGEEDEDEVFGIGCGNIDL